MKLVHMQPLGQQQVEEIQVENMPFISEHLVCPIMKLDQLGFPQIIENTVDYIDVILLNMVFIYYSHLIIIWVHPVN